MGFWRNSSLEGSILSATKPDSTLSQLNSRQLCQVVILIYPFL